MNSAGLPLQQNYQAAFRRIYTLLSKLEASPRPLTSQEIFFDAMAAGEGASLEDIRYDLNLLQTMGFPLIREENPSDAREPRWSFRHRFPYGRDRSLSVLETFAFFLIRKSLNRTDPHDFRDALNGLLRVIHGTEPEERLIPIRDLDLPRHSRALEALLGKEKGGLDSKSLATIRMAAQIEQTVDLTYTSKQEAVVKRVTLKAHSFYFLKGVYYLVLRSEEQCRTKAVPLQQIHSVELTREGSVGDDFRDANASSDKKTVTSVFFP
jgi:predicted DNA-binding transcriptional regulator YafY